jgi:hypothetical protein
VAERPAQTASTVVYAGLMRRSCEGLLRRVCACGVCARAWRSLLRRSCCGAHAAALMSGGEADGKRRLKQRGAGQAGTKLKDVLEELGKDPRFLLVDSVRNVPSPARPALASPQSLRTGLAQPARAGPGAVGSVGYRRGRLRDNGRRWRGRLRPQRPAHRRHRRRACTREATRTLTRQCTRAAHEQCKAPRRWQGPARVVLGGVWRCFVDSA